MRPGTCSTTAQEMLTADDMSDPSLLSDLEQLGQILTPPTSPKQEAPARSAPPAVTVQAARVVAVPAAAERVTAAPAAAAAPHVAMDHVAALKAKALALGKAGDKVAAAAKFKEFKEAEAARAAAAGSGGDELVAMVTASMADASSLLVDPPEPTDEDDPSLLGTGRWARGWGALSCRTKFWRGADFQCVPCHSRRAQRAGERASRPGAGRRHSRWWWPRDAGADHRAQGGDVCAQQCQKNARGWGGAEEGQGTRGPLRLAGSRAARLPGAERSGSPRAAAVDGSGPGGFGARGSCASSCASLYAGPCAGPCARRRRPGHCSCLPICARRSRRGRGRSGRGSRPGRALGGGGDSAAQSGGS